MSKKRRKKGRGQEDGRQDDGLAKLRRMRQTAEAGEEERPETVLKRIRRESQSEISADEGEADLDSKAARIREAARRKKELDAAAWTGDVDHDSDEYDRFESKIERVRLQTGEPAPPSAPRPPQEKRDKVRGATSTRAATRPETEPAPSFRKRHDILVLVSALAIVATGTALYRMRLRPRLVPFEEAGLRLQRPAGWMKPITTTVPASPLIDDDTTASDGAQTTTFASSVDPRIRVEVQTATRPAYNNLRRTLGLYRASRYGALVETQESEQVQLGGRDWSRTRFRYAAATTAGGSPQVSSAIEYSTTNGDLLYVVTLHGTLRQIEELEDLVAPTLAIDASARAPAPGGGVP